MLYSDEPWSIDYNTANKIAKLPLPYVPYNVLKVVRHYPPPPPPSWSRVTLRHEACREREQIDVLTRCLLHPPEEGTLIPQESLRLQILDTIRAEDGRSAQLVTFYDPLYYNHYFDEIDPFLCADREYTREAAAYSRISASHVAGVPEYYGSYSLEIPVESKSRFVRLILIQRIDGVPMNKLDPFGLSLSQRQTIMKGVLDIETQVYKCDVRNLDVHPRNVIVQNVSSPRPKVVMIDFGRAPLGRSYDPERRPEEEQASLPGTYISPRIRWSVKNEKHFLVMNFKEWIMWNWNAWLKREYKDDEITDYMATHWKPESTDVWPPGTE